MTPFEYHNGIPIVITDAIIKKVRCRIHRKKRIDKKWLKRYGYKEVEDHSKMFFCNGKLFMSKKNYDRFKEELARKEKKNENTD